jgi:E3 ubiquitin-protein ligase RAD18
LLQKRHTEWLNLWNANCDAFIPKSKRELLRELDAWERTQGGQASAGANVVMRKDFDSPGWSAAHSEDYKRLIADAKKAMKAPTGPATSEEGPAGTEAPKAAVTPVTEQLELPADPMSVEEASAGTETMETGITDPGEMQPGVQPQPVEELTANGPDFGYQIVKTSGDDDQNRKQSQENMILESPVIMVEDGMA